MSDEDFPEADKIDEACHPRETNVLFGHETVEQEVLQAFTSGRSHHAWLITGLQGIGKATLAWRMARFLLAGGATPQDAELFADATAPNSLDIASDHPVLPRISALSEPSLLLIRRAWDQEKKRLKAQITVDEVRRLNAFFGLSATEGGKRVVIVDAADDMNVSAANALLKVLEEPPKNAVLLLISHQPARLLPTIRSRCRELRLAPLGADAMAKALAQADLDEAAGTTTLSAGSVGEAIRLISGSGLELYQRILGLLGTCPQIDRQALAKLAEHASQRGADARLDLFLHLFNLALSRMAQTGASAAPSEEAIVGEQSMLRRLSPNLKAAQAWAALSQELSARIAHGRSVNIDINSLIVDAFLQANATASQLAIEAPA